MLFMEYLNVGKRKTNYYLHVDHDGVRFNNEIRKRMDDGWELWGSTSVLAMHNGYDTETYSLYAQALVMYEGPLDEIESTISTVS